MISLRAALVAGVITVSSRGRVTDMTPVWVRWLRPAGSNAYHGMDSVPDLAEALVRGTSSFTTRPQLAGTFGMVASTHWLASAAGLAVLEKGGNAFDAAVAAGLVLQVVEPHLNGPGGEVPVIGFDAAGGGVFVLTARAPRRRRPRWTRSAAWAWTWCPAPACSRPAFRRPSAPGCCCWSGMARSAAGRDGVRDRLRGERLPDPGQRERGDRRGGWHVPRALAELGGACTCPAARRPPRVPGSGIRTWPPRTTRILTEAEAAGPTVRPRSRRPGAPSTRGSWPTRSPATWSRPRSWTSRAAGTAGCSPDPTWPAGAPSARPRSRSTTGA